MRKKNTQESEDEWWARLEKRIERVRARHELACLGMGTIILIYIYIYMRTQESQISMVLISVWLASLA